MHDKDALDPSAISDLAELNGKSFALFALDENDEGTIFVGTARWDGTHLYWERSDVAQPIEIPDYRLGMVKRTTASIRQIVQDAEYVAGLSVGTLTEDESHEYTPTGLKWPELRAKD